MRKRGHEESVRTVIEILLVGKDQQQAVLHFAVVDNAVQFLLSLLHAAAVRRVDDKD